MKTTLKFAAADVRRCVEHAARSTDWGVSYFDTDKTPRPQLILVHDDGVYLMSNGKPRDLREPGGERSFAAYAEGLDPERDADVWEKARAAVGGDDFAEYFDLGPEWIAEVARNRFAGLEIVLTETSLELRAVPEQRHRRRRQ